MTYGNRLARLIKSRHQRIFDSLWFDGPVAIPVVFGQQGNLHTSVEEASRMFPMMLVEIHRASELLTPQTSQPVSPRLHPLPNSFWQLDFRHHQLGRFHALHQLIERRLAQVGTVFLQEAEQFTNCQTLPIRRMQRPTNKGLQMR